MKQLQKFKVGQGNYEGTLGQDERERTAVDIELASVGAFDISGNIIPQNIAGGSVIDVYDENPMPYQDNLKRRDKEVESFEQ